MVSTITAEAVPEISPVDDKVSPGGKDPDARVVSKETTPPLELDACNCMLIPVLDGAAES